MKNGKRGTMWKKIIKKMSKRFGSKTAVLVLISTVSVGMLYGCGTERDTVISLDRVLETIDGTGKAENAEAGILAGEATEMAEANAEDSETIMIYVHVCGAVVHPGVVKVPEGSRAQAAVEAAGGFSEDADRDYVNLASRVSDGEQLYIPTAAEISERKASPEAEKSGLVNLNTADISRLCSLPGIGESRAGDIIAYRQEHGVFSDIEEIMQVPGIKESTFEKLKDLITVK
ncbi:MAG: helix-hairpin-helix domain-containing protein [Lachnospiraceae bacterium]|nr:helix-hairpin-helix domain-containing protein [Lachnospiraceae bacterium]